MALTDGQGYRVPPLKLGQPNLFTQLGSLGDLVVKVPSARGRADFNKYIKLGLSDPEDIRSNEELERFGNLSRAIEQFPEFAATRTVFGDDMTHFLIVHRIQHARLQAAHLVAIPDTRFIVLGWPRKLFGTRSAPVILQQRIRGVRLFDMVEPMTGVFLSRFASLKQPIREQLTPLVDSALRNHIDWNIQNFVLEAATNHLYYVDSKPTTLAAKWGTEHNLASLRETFLE
jgi:hypothetical protein